MATLTEPLPTEARDRSSLLEFAVLQEQSQIATADRDLQRRGLLDRRPRDTLKDRAFRLVHNLPDPTLVLKTWDVERAVDAFAASLDPSDPILDVGCYACDMLPALKRLGFRKLAGIDLNPAVVEMPYAEEIDYAVGDLLATPWPDGHFAGISAISVIEHGVSDDALCREVSRLLRPGGIFIFTTDFWPEKIATTQQIFGLDWRIFDTLEIEALLAVAARHNLHPTADPRALIGRIASPAIHFEGKDYTFLYGALIRGDG